MSRPILVPVDFSIDSEAALLWALRLARRVETSVVVLHVVHDPSEQPGYYLSALAGNDEIDVEDRLPRIEEAAASLLEGFLDEFRERHPELLSSVELKTRLVVGLPVRRILETADEIEAWHIVMGSQGRTGLSHLMIGSKAERVVRLARIPVTVVKHPDQGEDE